MSMQNQHISYQDQQNYGYNNQTNQQSNDTQANFTSEQTNSIQNNQSTEEQQLLEQLSILDNSLTSTNFIIIGILLNQQVIRIQR